LIETIPVQDLVIESSGAAALEAVGGLLRDDLLESWAAAG
jgi:hypothetical protein